jgi:hypothetical protein
MDSGKKKRVPGLKQAQIIIYFALIVVIGFMGYGLHYNLSGMSDMIIENDIIATDFTTAVLHLKSAFGYTGFIH